MSCHMPIITAHLVNSPAFPRTASLVEAARLAKGHSKAPAEHTSTVPPSPVATQVTAAPSNRHCHHATSPPPAQQLPPASSPWVARAYLQLGRQVHLGRVVSQLARHGAGGGAARARHGSRPSRARQAVRGGAEERVSRTTPRDPPEVCVPTTTVGQPRRSRAGCERGRFRPSCPTCSATSPTTAGRRTAGFTAGRQQDAAWRIAPLIRVRGVVHGSRTQPIERQLYNFCSITSSYKNYIRTPPELGVPRCCPASGSSAHESRFSCSFDTFRSC